MAQKKAVTRRSKAGGSGKKVSGSAAAVVPRGRHLIVGIGASAGGLEACTTLLRALPADTGMAFVLVQHLDPDHASMLVQLLSRSTPMNVSEARNGVRPAPNHLYVIPPNQEMTISRGRLELVGRHEGPRHMPIDAFFSSLAKDLGRRAIGVVLSGGASDGTAGLEAIRAEGGITFAQDESSARHPGMPHSAIASGCVDFVLPPEEIAVELSRIARLPYIKEEVAEEELDSSELFGKMVLALRTTTGVDFSGYRQSTIIRRIRRRMALHHIENPEAYLVRLQKDGVEGKALYEDILIHVTKFFRDEDVFQAMQERVVPALVGGRQDDPIRVWVPGCSTGEEVYSIAIVLLESLGNVADPGVVIFATDLSERAIERARAGLYGESALEEVSEERKTRFFVKTGRGYQISKRIRDICVFARGDLLKDPPFSRLDFISCRNVLIYMGSDLQKRMIEIFHYALKPGGYLMLGKSESAGPNSILFALEDRKHRIYIRKESPPHGVTARGAAREQTTVRAMGGASPVFDLTKAIERLLARRYMPPAVVVDADLQILQFHGDTSPYLKPAQGEAGLHLLKMVRQEIAFDLRELLQRARKEDATVRKSGVRFQLGGGTGETTVEVTPVKGRHTGQSDYLVVFLETKPAPRREPAVTGTAAAKREQRAEMERLRQELAAAREFLQSAIEDADLTNEELRAANEEVLSNNEELQSTNEELETAKEQLQSSNEELTTLNEELQTRNTELAELNNDLNNLLVNVHIPIIILGADYRIRHCAPVAENLFNIMTTDAGRRISDIQPNFDGVDLTGLIASVLNTGVAVEREVQDRAGLWHSLRVQPYKVGNRVEGALVAGLDVDRLKRSLEETQLARDYATAVVETTHEPLLVLDETLRIMSANTAFCDTFQITPVIGRPLFELGDGEWNVTSLREILSEVLSTRQAKEDLEWTHHFERAGDRIILLNVRPVLGPAESPRMILLALNDVTSRETAEEARRDSEALFRTLFETSTRAILGVSDKGNIVFASRATTAMFGWESAELIGMGIDQLMPVRSRERHAGLLTKYFSSPPARMGPNMEILGLKKDGTEFPIEVSLSSLSTRKGVVAVAFVDDVTERKAVEKTIRETSAALLESREHLRRLTSGLLRSQDEERRRISHEMHDDLNQRLASLVMVVQTAEELLPKPSKEARGLLEQARKQAEQISDGVRRAAYDLHPSMLDHLGLVAALKSLCADFGRQEELKVAFRDEGVPEEMPLEASLCLFRVAQESLRNVRKHTSERTARMTLRGSESIIHLIIEDSGPGFGIEARKRSGLGIVSIEERVRLAGGSLVIEARTGGGTRVTASLPLKEPQLE
ncbi:MAG: PAS domain S-box protein [Acidobacteria bacterium]|nr:PAS domain S-box protein [Acidobacteriota bacterium]